MKLAHASIQTPKSTVSEIKRCRFDSKVLACFGFVLTTTSAILIVFCVGAINYALFFPAGETEIAFPDYPPSAAPSQAAELIKTSFGWGIFAVFLLVWGESIRFRATGRGREADLHERIMKLEGRIEHLREDKSE